MANLEGKFTSRLCAHWDKNIGKLLFIYIYITVRERGCFSQRKQPSVFASALAPIEQLSNSTSKELPILLLLRRLLHTSHPTTQPLRHVFLSATQAFLRVSHSATQTFLHVSHSATQPLNSGFCSCQPLSHSGFLRVSHPATQDLEWLSG